MRIDLDNVGMHSPGAQTADDRDQHCQRLAKVVVCGAQTATDAVIVDVHKHIGADLKFRDARQLRVDVVRPGTPAREDVRG